MRTLANKVMGPSPPLNKEVRAKIPFGKSKKSNDKKRFDIGDFEERQYSISIGSTVFRDIPPQEQCPKTQKNP
jgi:hypothetical protein